MVEPRLASGTPRYRLLAFDLDGTLLESDGTLSPESAAFLRELAAGGMRLVAATGRRLASALPHLRRAGLRGSCVVHNGAMVADIESAAPLTLRPLAPTIAQHVIDRLRDHGCAPVVFTDVQQGLREILVERGAPDPTGFVAWYTRYAAGHLTECSPPLVVDSTGSDGSERVLRIVTHGEPAALDRWVRELVAEQSGALRGFVQREMAVDGHRAELLAHDADKWTAILAVASQHAIEPAAIVTVGDAENDVEMLAGAGYSLAAPGASAAARQVAREQIDGDGPRAVVRALRRLFAHRLEC